MALGSEYVRYERRRGVGWLTLDRPQALNALTRDMYEALHRACVEGDADPDLQATVITGTGDVFSAGGDVKQGIEFLRAIERDDDSHPATLFGAGPGSYLPVDPIVAIQRARKLVIAAVNGLCQGGGFMTAMVADLTIASERATFRVPEALLGVVDPWVASRLPLYVGMERAKRIMFMCRPFSAQEALAWGFVSEVVAHEDLLTRVDALLDEILRTSPRAREAYKAAANRLLPDGSPDSPDYLGADAVFRSGDAREGMTAFAEKRAPSWVPEGR